ncbi:hypothetical protein [Nocardia acididurans]|nr:hypothetical protein [Nocardia acididurans]
MTPCIADGSDLDHADRLDQNWITAVPCDDDDDYYCDDYYCLAY